MSLPRVKVKRVISRSPSTTVIVKEKPEITFVEVPKTIRGEQGPSGLAGERGLQGSPGVAPEHEVKGNNLRFKNPDGSWGKWINIGSSGYFPGQSAIQYLPVKVAAYRVGSDLIPGTNILGVNYAGDVTITLPANLDNNKVIVVKDESGNAGTYNITIVGES